MTPPWLRYFWFHSIYSLLPHAVCSLRYAVCSLRSAVCSLQSAVFSLQMSYTERNKGKKQKHSHIYTLTTETSSPARRAVTFSISLVCTILCTRFALILSFCLFFTCLYGTSATGAWRALLLLVLVLAGRGRARPRATSTTPERRRKRVKTRERSIEKIKFVFTSIK